CLTCGHSAQAFNKAEMSSRINEQGAEQAWMFNSYSDSDSTNDTSMGEDDYGDPLAQVASSETLADALLQQLELSISPDDICIAEMLVGNLNEHGYLEISVDEIAHEACVAVERVEYVLSQLQT